MFKENLIYKKVEKKNTKHDKVFDQQGSGNTDKRFKMVAWEKFGREKSYLEIGILFMMMT